MISQPNGIRYSELEYVLKKIGCVKREGTGSHVVFYYAKYDETQTRPKHKPTIKKCYIINVINSFKLKEYVDEIS